MTIKSLLIASAAALASVTAAQAADAVVAAEPEPMEYVRVCDAYGSGFFYIPGTETCLAISGYTWYQVGVGTAGNWYEGWLTAFPGGWNKSIEARVNFDARTETEWGTLRSYIRAQATWNGVGDGPVALDQAWLSLGGLRMGYSESAWVDTLVGGNSSWGSHTWSGLNYGYQQRAFIQYGFTGGNGFYGLVSLEDDALNGNGYVPDVVGLVGVNQGWGGVWGRVAYDESAAGWAASIGAHLNIPNMEGSSLRLIGYYASNNNSYSVGSQWSILGSYYHQFTPKLGASIGAQYFGGTNHYASAANSFLVEAGVVFTPVTNLELRVEGTYDSGNDSVGGFARVTRYF